MDEIRLSVTVRGMVQGVGFRWWTQGQAGRLGLRGSAANRPDGSVAIVVEGPHVNCQELLSMLLRGRAPGSVSGVDESWSAPRGEPAGFRVG
jgi:acylphosphatase